MNRTKIWTVAALAAGGLLGWMAANGEFHTARLLAAEPKADATAADKLDRTVLPIPEPKPAPITTLDARNAKAPPRFEVKAPAKAPNVLIVLIDDMGFGQASAFSGPIHMPTLEKLAKGGLSYNQFHTTALCSPTRAALLSGRNHHVNNMGSITETATAFPGQTGQRPNAVASLPEMLRLNGYSTAAFGKSHETAAWEEGADVGLDGETPVSDDYPEGDNKFTGKIQKVVIEVGPVKLGAAGKEELWKTKIALQAAE